MRLLLNNTTTEVSEITASYSYHKDTPNDKKVYLQITRPMELSAFFHVMERDGIELADELENEFYFFDMSRYSSFEEVWDDAQKRVREAFEKGCVDISDLISQWDYVWE